MSCANHPDRERAAFCQNCGKPLCTECIRTLGTSTLCEPCLAARVAGAPPYAPAPGFATGPMPPSVPNPGLAAVLGFIPGVGAMYNGQYAKGIVHLMVFAILVSLANENGIFGLFVAGWIFYMVIEAHHTAKARRDGLPLPNPFGLNDLSERLGFGKSWPSSAPYAAPPPNPASSNPADSAAPYASPYGYAPTATYVPPPASWGAPQESGYAYVPPVPPMPPMPPMPPYVDPNTPFARRIPTGALWLIGLGILFLFGNTGIYVLHARYFGPILLIGIGVWIFVRKMTASGQGLENDGTPAYHYRLTGALRSAVWVFVSGILWLLDALRILTWDHSWPIFLIAGGVLVFLNRAVAPVYPYPAQPFPPQPYPPAAPYPGPPYTPPSPVTSTAIVPAHTDASTDLQEGR